MIDWTKPIETVAGLPARVICTDRKYYNRPILVLVDEGEQHGELCYPTTQDGKLHVNGVPFLRNKPEEKVKYYNSYFMYNSLEAARRRGGGEAEHSSITFKVTELGGKVTKVEIAE